MTDLKALVKKIAATRQASSVERCHAIRHIGSYSDGLHAANCLKLLYVLWPEDFSRLSPFLLFHDDGEFVVGDIPGPTFWAFPELGEKAGELEARVRGTLGLPSANSHNLSPEDLLKLEFCDKFEFLLWSIEQRQFGNQFVAAPAGRSVVSLSKKPYPDPAPALIALAASELSSLFVADRVSELLEVLKQ